MTPEEEERVRRALADAGAADRSRETSAPAEVVARLDEVLADLVAARGATAAPGEEERDDLARHRRRRWAGALVAAAALAAIALGGPAVLRGVTTTTGSASSESAGGGSAGGSSAQSGPPSGGTAGEPATPAGGAKALASGVLRPPDLRSGSLRRDVERAVLGSVAVPGDTAGSADSPGGASGNPSGDPSGNPSGEASGGASEGTTSRRADVACDLPGIPPAFSASQGADVIAVRLDGRRATLVVAAPRDGTRLARVYACGGGQQPAASTRIPAR